MPKYTNNPRNQLIFLVQLRFLMRFEEQSLLKKFASKPLESFDKLKEKNAGRAVELSLKVWVFS